MYVCVEQRVFCRKMSGDDDDHAQRHELNVGIDHWLRVRVSTLSVCLCVVSS